MTFADFVRWCVPVESAAATCFVFFFHGGPGPGGLFTAGRSGGAAAPWSKKKEKENHVSNTSQSAAIRFL